MDRLQLKRKDCDMALDTKLIRSIRMDNFDAWMKPDDAGNLERFTDDRTLRWVQVDPWEQVVAWRFGRLGEPNVFVRFQYRRIRTAWGFSDHVDFTKTIPTYSPAEEFLTPVYVVSGVRESDEDFLTEAEQLQKQADAGKFESTTLVYDATSSGVAVEHQLWNLRGFRRIVPLRIIGNDGLKPDGYLSVVGRSSVLSELEHVFDQRRIVIPDDKRFDKLSRQLSGIRVERTPQGYYKAIDEGTNEELTNQVWTLAMGLSLVESELSQFGTFKWYV